LLQLTRVSKRYRLFHELELQFCRCQCRLGFSPSIDSDCRFGTFLHPESPLSQFVQWLLQLRTELNGRLPSVAGRCHTGTDQAAGHGPLAPLKLQASAGKRRSRGKRQARSSTDLIHQIGYSQRVLGLFASKASCSSPARRLTQPSDPFCMVDWLSGTSASPHRPAASSRRL